MNYEIEKNLICEYARMLQSSNLTPGTSGNLSIIDRKTNTVLITPSGVKYDELKPEQIVEMDLDGNILFGEYKPSSEYHLHTLMYKHKPKSMAIIHAHSLYSTSVSILGQTIKAVHYAIAEAGTHEIPLAPYRLMGTYELAKVCIESIGESKAVLMKNHGITVYGKDLSDAFSTLRNIEWCAQLQMNCQSVAEPQYLSKEEIDEVIVAFEHYGQPEKLKKD